MSRLSAHPSLSNLRRLLATVGSDRTSESAPPEAVKHDWRKPRYFNEDQYNRLAAMMSQVAAAIGAAFTRFFNRELAVAPTSIAQHFAGPLSALGVAEGRYYLTFAAGKDKTCGFLSVTAATALRWARRLLSDTESNTDPNQPLSSLEESLLADLVTAMMDAFLSPLRVHQELRPGDRLLKNDPAVRFEPAQEVCTVVFAVTSDESSEKDDVLFLLPCSLLSPLVGKGRQATQQISPEELSRTLMEHVQQMPITVTAQLACTTLSFEELLELDENDVLLLDRSPDESIELLVEDQITLRGRAAKSGGRRAVVLSQATGNPVQKATKATAN
jgi:flagellar motor switch protein FliM